MKKLFALYAVACFLSGVAPAYADMAVLTSPERQGALQPEGAIRFTLSSDISAAQMDNLFVEFDGYDVTSMVALDGKTVTFQPAQRLSAGDYRLRLLQKLNNGKFIEMQKWTVRVSGGGVSETTLNGNLDAMASYLAADNLQGDNKEPHGWTQATLNADAKSGGESWDMSGRFQGYYDSIQKHNTPDFDNFELGEYALTMRKFLDGNKATLNFGNHDAGVNNLLVSDFYRRGVSAELNMNDRAVLTAFSQDPARAIGNMNVSGFGEANQRASGAFAKFFPSSTYGERVFAETGYYQGEGTIIGKGSGVPGNPDNIASGWVVAAEGQSLNDKLNLRGDFAHSRFDDDGSGVVVAERPDGAFRTVVKYAPVGDLKTVDAESKQWTLIGMVQQVGTYFKSMTNSGLPQDEKRVSLASNYQHDTVTMTSELYATENNVNDIGALPTDRTFGGLSQFSFSPVAFKKDLSPDHWFTYSTFTAGASYSNENRVKKPSLFVGDHLNQSTFTANAGWTASFEKSTLSLTHTFADFMNDALPATRYVQNVSSLNYSWTPNETVTLTPSFQQEFTNPADGKGAYARSYLAFDTSEKIIPDKLLHTFHYSSLLDSGGPDSGQFNAASTLTWQIKEAERNKPGIALALSGNYQNLLPVVPSPVGTAEGESYKVYLQLKIGVPFGF